MLSVQGRPVASSRNRRSPVVETMTDCQPNCRPPRPGPPGPGPRLGPRPRPGPGPRLGPFGLATLVRIVAAFERQRNSWPLRRTAMSLPSRGGQREPGHTTRSGATRTETGTGSVRENVGPGNARRAVGTARRVVPNAEGIVVEGDQSAEVVERQRGRSFGNGRFVQVVKVGRVGPGRGGDRLGAAVGAPEPNAPLPRAECEQAIGAEAERAGRGVKAAEAAAHVGFDEPPEERGGALRNGGDRRAVGRERDILDAVGSRQHGDRRVGGGVPQFDLAAKLTDDRQQPAARTEPQVAYQVRARGEARQGRAGVNVPEPHFPAAGRGELMIGTQRQRGQLGLRLDGVMQLAGLAVEKRNDGLAGRSHGDRRAVGTDRDQRARPTRADFDLRERGQRRVRLIRVPERDFRRATLRRCAERRRQERRHRTAIARRVRRIDHDQPVAVECGEQPADATPAQC